MTKEEKLEKHRLRMRKYRQDPRVREREKQSRDKYREMNKAEIYKKYREKYLINKEEIIKKTNNYNKNKDSGLLSTYLGMVRRCKYPKEQNYKYYGGKGICIEWKSYQDFRNDMFESYMVHLLMYGRQNTTINRIDSSKNYSKKNCHWATWKQQGLSKRLSTG